DATVQSAIALTRELMDKYHIPADHVIRHYDVTGKICPNPYVYNHTKHTWEAFKVALAASETAVVGWNRDSKGKYRYVQADGTYAVNKWLLINHHWYLFGKDGYMLTGWQRWNGSSVIGLDEPGDWYFLDNTVGGPLEGACWHERVGEYGAWEIWEVK
ncbi:MAG: N-acetylmuramoyl-L-alanine amidase, partial [[Clostridium] symbiosum]